MPKGVYQRTFEGIAVSCDKCGYIWVYQGSAIFATCPSCTYKTKVSKP